MFSIIQLHILIIAMLTSVACVLPGIFLVLRGIALMSDAISHAILLGIIVMFLFVQDLQSPLLIVGATFAGILTVVCTELLIQTRRLKKDAAIGLVFPLFFSVGVILISQFARNVHLDVDMVLLGEITFAPFNRLIIAGVDYGPYAIWTMGVILFINALLFYLFYKELALVTFDYNLARVLGFSPGFIYYGLMVMTSITAVGAFDVVGSIVVVALMITPPATAYLLTNRLLSMVFASVIISIFSAISGYWLAYIADVSIAGSIATMTGMFFMAALLGAPEKGIVASLIFGRKQRVSLAGDVLCVYLVHDGFMSVADVARELGWSKRFAKAIIDYVHTKGWLTQENTTLKLTSAGRAYALEVDGRLSPGNIS